MTEHVDFNQAPRDIYIKNAKPYLFCMVGCNNAYGTVEAYFVNVFCRFSKTSAKATKRSKSIEGYY